MPAQVMLLPVAFKLNSILMADAATGFAWAGSATALAGGIGRLPVQKSFSFGK
jgi:hypothetical protein